MTLFSENQTSDIYNHFVYFLKCCVLCIAPDLTAEPEQILVSRRESNGKTQHRRNTMITPFLQPGHHSKVIKHDTSAGTVRKRYLMTLF